MHSRYAATDEIAAMVAYLAGPEAGFVTGASLTNDHRTKLLPWAVLKRLLVPGISKVTNCEVQSCRYADCWRLLLAEWQGILPP